MHPSGSAARVGARASTPASSPAASGARGIGATPASARRQRHRRSGVDAPAAGTDTQHLQRTAAPAPRSITVHRQLAARLRKRGRRAAAPAHAPPPRCLEAGPLRPASSQRRGRAARGASRRRLDRAQRRRQRRMDDLHGPLPRQRGDRAQEGRTRTASAAACRTRCRVAAGTGARHLARPLRSRRPRRRRTASAAVPRRAASAPPAWCGPATARRALCCASAQPSGAGSQAGDHPLACRPQLHRLRRRSLTERRRAAQAAAPSRRASRKAAAAANSASSPGPAERAATAAAVGVGVGVGGVGVGVGVGAGAGRRCSEPSHRSSASSMPAPQVEVVQ